MGVSNFLCFRVDNTEAEIGLLFFAKFAFLPIASCERLQGFLVLISGLDAMMSFRRLRSHWGGVSCDNITASGSSINIFPCSQGMSLGLRGISSPGRTKSEAGKKINIEKRRISSTNVFVTQATFLLTQVESHSLHNLFAVFEVKLIHKGPEKVEWI